MNVGSVISKAIKEGKWINIKYQHSKEETTIFWIAVMDIDFVDRKFSARIFNDKKSYNTIDTTIYFDKILEAQVIEFSDYIAPDWLLDKIEKNLNRCRWLEYDKFNNNVLNYYNECNFLDNDPFQKEYVMIPGIDLDVLRKKKEYCLNDEQTKMVLNKIYRYDIKNENKCHYDMCISVLSIDDGDKKYVVCYYDVLFDPYNKTMRIKNELKFNKSFLIEGRKHSLFNYVNMDVEKFIEGFVENYSEKRKILYSNLKNGEKLNERPDMFLLEREYVVDLESVFNSIEHKYINNELNIPLKSFFGNISKRNNIRRKEPSIVIYDNNININQMRVIYNALKYPVTYVQGPPGTGKTQTILNVLLSAFFDDKTLLVCSSNNKPVDGIVEKLNFKYNGENVLFPFLRLGKISDVIEATKKIKKLYEFETDKVVKEYLINKIKINNDDSNGELLKLLNIQEQRVLIEDYIISLDKLLSSMQNSDSAVAKNLKTRKEQLSKDLSELPKITNDQVTKLFTPISTSFQLQQYIYFKSLAYIQKLKEPKYKELIDICYIEDDEERASEFNKWTQSNSNMRLLNNAFPIIFSTNISSCRLGNPEYKFDLVVMDEAGQCNVAHALIPIAKAESLLLVGDPNQLKPVIVLEDSVNEKLMEKYNVPESYNYKGNSILSVMRNHDNISKYILLKYHYRCGRKIIKFSNDRYYGSELDLSCLKEEGELEFLSVKNANIFEKNAAYDEANEIIKYIKRNNMSNVSIITPFVNQQNLLNKLLIENKIEDVNCGTIHSLQGAEKETIILSTAISSETSKKTYEWIKNNFELINVGVTRAKKKLVIAGDIDAIEANSDKTDDLYNLIQYAKQDGKITVPANETIKIEIGKSNGSKNEDEFFKTISQFCSVHTSYEVKRNVLLKDVFKDDKTLANSKKEFDIVIYERKWPILSPKIVVELCGGEHFGTRSREISDNQKRLICNKRKIDFIMVDNSFIKSYELIKDLIIGAKNKKAVQLSLFDVE